MLADGFGTSLGVLDVAVIGLAVTVGTIAAFVTYDLGARLVRWWLHPASVSTPSNPEGPVRITPV